MIKPVEPEPIRLGGSPTYPVYTEPAETVPVVAPQRPVPLGELADPTTDRMRQETGHDCIACPTPVRDLMATAHNAINALDAARDGAGGWDRAWRKVNDLRASVARMEQFSDEHFVALNGWRRP